MVGEWSFEFKYAKRGTLQILKYQEMLLKIREEFKSQFDVMKVEEGSAEWATLTDGNAPANNIFAKFTYKCTKPHVYKGPEHGKWTLLWNPKEADVKNHLHARCAPILFKDLSNKIQEKVSKEFPSHFTVSWRNGQTGYENSGLGAFGGFGGAMGGGGGGFDVRRFVRQMQIADKWNDSDSDESERCPHFLPWSYCCDCSDDLLDMMGYGD